MERERYQPGLVNTGHYSTPRRDIPSGQMSKQYRGLQREPLLGWIEALRGSGVVEPTNQELEACLFLQQLVKAGKAENDIVFALEDARELMQKIEPPVEREIIWARRMGVDDPPEPPAATLFLGYEPTEFYPPSCRSAIAEGMFFTCPNSHDQEELRFEAYHDKLNKWGLFDTPADAEEFLKVYRVSLTPNEQRYVYYITEVREAH